MNYPSKRAPGDEPHRVLRAASLTVVLWPGLAAFATSIACPPAYAQARTERASVSSSGAQANGPSYNPALSADGNCVAFCSDATDLVAGDTNEHTDVFVRDRRAQTTERVSLASGGEQGDGDSGYFNLSISADGRFVAFYSFAANLVPGDSNGCGDVFVHDRRTGTTERVSVDSSGAQGNADSGYFRLSISPDGRCVAFDSSASNLAPAGSATNLAPACGPTGIALFVHDRETKTTERVRDDAFGTRRFSRFARAVPADDGSVAFASYATDFFTGVEGSSVDILVRDGSSSLLERISVDVDGMESDANSSSPTISADARCVAFQSSASRLVQGDTNGCLDVFVRERCARRSAVARDLGVGFAWSCPCSNRVDPPDSIRKR